MILSYVRTILLYAVLIGVIRLMGKRQVGEMEPSEFVVTMLVANLAAIPMQDGGIPLYSGLVPILTVLASELVFSTLSMRSVKMRRILCGKPVILIENGKIIQENLRKTRITMDELSGQLRNKDVLDPTTVQYAILETNGVLSVFPFPQERPAAAKDAGVPVKPQALPYTLVSDGYLYRDNLKAANKTEKWVEKQLQKENATLVQTWLFTVDEDGKTVFLRKEQP